jgi:hypothetical protein
MNYTNGIMKSSSNTVALDFTSYTESLDTDISVCVRGDNVDDDKIVELLNRFLGAIGSSLKVLDGRND